MSDEWTPIDYDAIDTSVAPWNHELVLLARGDERYAARWTRGEVHGPCWCTPDGYVIYRATHWYPLPPAPSVSPAKEGSPE